MVVLIDEVWARRRQNPEEPLHVAAAEALAKHKDRIDRFEYGSLSLVGYSAIQDKGEIPELPVPAVRDAIRRGDLVPPELDGPTYAILALYGFLDHTAEALKADALAAEDL